MSIRFKCENCGETIKAPVEYAGKRGKCKSCGSSVRIPHSEGANAPAVSSSSVDSASLDAVLEDVLLKQQPAAVSSKSNAPVPASRSSAMTVSAKDCVCCGKSIPGDATQCRYCGESAVDGGYAIAAPTSSPDVVVCPKCGTSRTSQIAEERWRCSKCEHKFFHQSSNPSARSTEDAKREQVTSSTAVMREGHPPKAQKIRKRRNYDRVVGITAICGVALAIITIPVYLYVKHQGRQAEIKQQIQTLIQTARNAGTSFDFEQATTALVQARQLAGSYRGGDLRARLDEADQMLATERTGFDQKTKAGFILFEGKLLQPQERERVIAERTRKEQDNEQRIARDSADRHVNDFKALAAIAGRWSNDLDSAGGLLELIDNMLRSLAINSNYIRIEVYVGSPRRYFRYSGSPLSLQEYTYDNGFERGQKPAALAELPQGNIVVTVYVDLKEVEKEAYQQLPRVKRKTIEDGIEALVRKSVGTISLSFVIEVSIG